MKLLSNNISLIITLAFFATLCLALIKYWYECREVSSPTAIKSKLANKFSPIEYNDLCPTPYGKIIIFGVSIRLALYILSFFIYIIFIVTPKGFNVNELFTMWHKWDSTGYVSIATSGYVDVAGKHILLVFFPLYSWSIKLLYAFTKNYYVSGIILSNLYYICGIIYLYKLVALNFNPKTAWNTIVLISVFPFSFFYGSLMTESLMLFMISATFYYIFRHNWRMVMVFGILSGLTRMVGSLMIIAAILEYIRFYKPFSNIKNVEWNVFWRNTFTHFIYIPLMSLGGLTYLYINWTVSGDPFKFLVYQKEIWHGSPQFFFKTLNGQITNIFSGLDVMDGSIFIPQVMLFILAICVMGFTFRKIPSIYTLTLGGYMALSYASSWMLSGGRYMSPAIPLFIGLAVWTYKKPLAYQIIVIVSSVFLGMYVVGYMLFKQIM